jgi:hypothetical protein
MVFSFHKFKHYLLGNIQFGFYVDHMVILSLVNKPQVLSHIVKWLFLLLEYEFIVVYKLGCTHVVIYALSKLSNTTEPIDVIDQITNVVLLYL